MNFFTGNLYDYSMKQFLKYHIHSYKLIYLNILICYLKSCCCFSFLDDIDIKNSAGQEISIVMSDSFCLTSVRHKFWFKIINFDSSSFHSWKYSQQNKEIEINPWKTILKKPFYYSYSNVLFKTGLQFPKSQNFTTITKSDNTKVLFYVIMKWLSFRSNKLANKRQIHY